jgi:hypothetical protein
MPMQENFATILESVGDVRAARVAVTHGDRTRTWRHSTTARPAWPVSLLAAASAPSTAWR